MVPLNPSTFNRVYIVGKGGILVRSRYRDGPAVAGAAIVMHYCIMMDSNFNFTQEFKLSRLQQKQYFNCIHKYSPVVVIS